MERYGWRLLLGVSLLPSLVALLFYTLVPESPGFLYEKEEDEIKDVTLDIDKIVAGEIQNDEAHHTFKMNDPVDRSSRTQG
uniref:Organic cation/carnitine transporter 7-like n=1 Tax=Tanacetum cinerariifolium TaxID=118510 RepID=A0A699V4Y5_TANCI|nr:organic cation/carnitine transporter 7-like [Tanacetum cinerariifolium]